jgi:penicillin-binding protein 2
MRDVEAILRHLDGNLKLDKEEVLRKVKLARRRSPFRPIPLQEGLSWEEVAWVENHRLDLPGVWVEAEPRRFYPYGPLAAHLLGYVGEITKERLRKWKERGYRVGDRIGKRGLESRLEPFLRGRDGGLQVEVDAQGRQLMVLNEVDFQPGANVVLTLDVEIQRLAEEALGDRAGAVVVGDPRTGEILAMVSHPAFDPNLFSKGLPPETWKKLIRDPKHPLQNRVTMGLYPPGSTYKIVTAAAALEEGVVDFKTRLYCPGYYRMGSREFRCWKKSGHGWLRLRDALIQSCDVFFYQLGERLGVDRLAKYAWGFGLGSPTGFDPDEEKGGLVPTAEWKKKKFGSRWHPGETLSLAIGQGFNLVTPLQQFVLISAVANGGFIRTPRVVHHIESAQGIPLGPWGRYEIRRVPVKERTLAFLRDALRAAVENPRGTGQRARLPGVSVAGKTGTAQVVEVGEDRKSREELPYHKRDHAWFLCFAPVEAPRVAVVVLVEHGGHGGAVAAPIARKILQGYFQKYRKGEENLGV